MTRMMRDVIIERIIDEMGRNKRIFFLAADFGAPSLDRLRENFTDRFINVGIAEQNLINVATGLGLEGFLVFAYAIAPFLTMRAFEQIRVNLSLHAQVRELNVNLIGVGAGLSYEVSGPTHHSLEDLAIMRLLPNFSVLSPCDSLSALSCLDYAFKNKGPKYIRLDGKPLEAVYSDKNSPDMDKGFREIRKGKRVCLVSTGYTTHTALKVAGKANFPVGVIDVTRLKPLQDAALFKALARYDQVVTLEEGFIGGGGLDTLISGILTDRASGIRLERVGFSDKFIFELGPRAYLHSLVGLDEPSVSRMVAKLNRCNNK